MCRTTSAQPLRVDESAGQTVHRRPALPDTGQRRPLLIACSGSTVRKALAHDEFGPACLRIKGLGFDSAGRSSSRSSWPRSTPRSPTISTSAWSGQLRVNKSPRHQRLAGNTTPLPHAFHPEQFQLDQPGRTLVRLRHRPAGPLRQPILGPSPRKVTSRAAVDRVNVRSFRRVKVLLEVADEPGQTALALDRLILGRCCG
jgi:hypothetical protein